MVHSASSASTGLLFVLLYKYAFLIEGSRISFSSSLLSSTLSLMSLFFKTAFYSDLLEFFDSLFFNLVVSLFDSYFLDSSIYFYFATFWLPFTSYFVYLTSSFLGCLIIFFFSSISSSICSSASSKAGSYSSF